MRLHRFLLATLCLPTLLSAADPIVGTWTTDGGKSQIAITAAPDGTFRGHIVGLKEPLYTNPKEGTPGTPKVDRHNPDPSLKTRPLIGLQILDGFQAAGPDRWEKGRIYDPENGKTYQCRMKLSAPNRLEVRGFIGISLIGRTTVWTR